MVLYPEIIQENDWNKYLMLRGEYAIGEGGMPKWDLNLMQAESKLN